MGVKVVWKHKLYPKTPRVIDEQMWNEAGQIYWCTRTQGKATSVTGYFWEQANKVPFKCVLHIVDPVLEQRNGLRSSNIIMTLFLWHCI